MGNPSQLGAVRSIAFCIQALLGIATGLTINTYIKLIDLRMHGWPEAGYEGVALFGYGVLAFCFLIELFLEVRCGAIAEQKGSRATFMTSFILRGCYALMLIGGLYLGHDSASLGLTLAAVTVFAASFTLFSGNFEAWLQAQFEDVTASMHAFAYTRAFFYGGITLGSVVSILALGDATGWALWEQSVPMYLGSAVCCFGAAGLCTLIPEQSQSEALARKTSFFSILRQLVFARKDLDRIQVSAKRQLRSDRQLNYLFWVLSFFYGLEQLIDVAIPFFLLSSVGGTVGDAGQSHVLIVILALWLPLFLGSLSLIPRPAAGDLKCLTKGLTLFCCLTALFPVCFLFPQLEMTLLAGMIVFTRLLVGRIDPVFYNLLASRVNQTSSVPKTLLSIGERRKKVGAALALVLSGAFSYMFSTVSDSAGFMVILGSMSFCAGILLLMLIPLYKKVFDLQPAPMATITHS